MADMIATPDEVDALTPGQWVRDADGRALCLVNTHVGWAQRMWQHPGGRAWTRIEGVTYPLTLMYLQEECLHQVGTQECGHCRHCGAVVAAPDRPAFDLALPEEVREWIAADSLAERTADAATPDTGETA